MRTVFNYKDHSIVFERKISGATLLVDNRVCEQMKDGIKAQLANYKLNGIAVNADESHDQVCIEVNPGFFMDTVTLYYNGKEIENKQVR